MKELAIIVVAYNRTDSVTRLLKSLEKAFYGSDRPSLIISVDKSNTDAVERFADKYVWPHGEKIVRKHEENMGLRNHMLSLGEWFDRFEALVILEDDIVVSPCFYEYTKQCVSKYHNNPKIAGISLYSYEVNYQTELPFQAYKDEHDAYFMNCAVSWGEVWMKDSWRKFYTWYLDHMDFPPSPSIPDRIMQWKPSSWLKYHTRYCIENNLFFVHPYYSLSTNYADPGVHNYNAKSTSIQTNLIRGNKESFFLPDSIDDAVVYDGFFENKKLYSALNLSESDCCLDLCGTRGNRENKRYWLTTVKTNFKIVKSFGLRYRPIEVNILEGVDGNDIYLYDTNCQSHPFGISSQAVLFSYHIDYVSLLLKKIGYKVLIKTVWNHFIK